MSRAWLLKRAAYLVALAVAGASIVGTLVLGRNSVAAIFDTNWPRWVNNLANLSQIGLVLIALLSWCQARIKRLEIVKPDGAAAWLLACLALLLPPRDRERFVREVAANLADRQRWWQRVEELLSVAAVAPALAVILRVARRRRT